MGITIIIAIIAVVLLAIACKFEYERWSIFPGVVGAVAGIVAAVLILILIVGVTIAPYQLSSMQAKSAMYQELVDNINDATDQYRLYTEIVEWNADILEQRDLSRNFMFRYLSSPLWEEVPLVELTAK